MSEITLKFNNIMVNKKEFHKSKEPIDLMSVNVDQIVVSDKFKHSDEGFKYFIGYQEDETVKPLCIILPQMSGYIKYFEYGNRNMSFLITDDEVREKYEQIWYVIKTKLKIEFQSLPVYDKKCLKTKVREYDGVIKTNFLCIIKNMRYTCIACITIDSVKRMDQKNCPQLCLEECKYRIKKKPMSRFINTELNLNLESDSDGELIAKLKSDSDNDYE